MRAQWTQRTKEREIWCDHHHRGVGLGGGGPCAPDALSPGPRGQHGLGPGGGTAGARVCGCRRHSADEGPAGHDAGHRQ
jgi:hypothetical protein